MEQIEIRDQEITAIEEFAAKRDAMLGEIRKVIVGQDKVVEEVLIALFSRGHCLLVGVPGLAKTLLISTLAEILELEFNRIQFTPDLMPSDINGTDILQGRFAVSIEDIQALAPSVLRHRIIPNFKAQAEGISSLDIVSRLLTEVKPSEDGKGTR